MVRPLRIDVPGSWHHATARGHERSAAYRDDTDRRPFLGLLAELEARFGSRIHGYGLMANHDHLIVETGDAALIPPTQRLNVSYMLWFNRPWRRVGQLFNRRFEARWRRQMDADRALTKLAARAEQMSNAKTDPNLPLLACSEPLDDLLGNALRPRPTTAKFSILKLTSFCVMKRLFLIYWCGIFICLANGAH